MKELIEMLGYCRPNGSSTEEDFIRKFIDPLGAEMDAFGNRIITVGDKPNIMWSSHTDTVHKNEGIVPILIDGNLAKVAPWSGANCLGADCTTGVWLMMEMIRAGVPGLYVFHRAEEVGCQGSRYIVENTPELVSGIDACIAFDRYGTNSIVTHQMGSRGCSPTFSKSLAKQLPGYVDDDGGVYTDSYEYFGIISECTNVSVGYYNQHSRQEIQNLSFAEQLRDWLICIDTTSLIFERVPIDPYETYYTSFGKRRRSLLDVVTAYPDVTADFLENCGFTVDDLDDYIWGSRSYYGIH